MIGTNILSRAYYTPVLKRISIARIDLELRLCQHFEPLISELKYHSFEIFQLGLFEKMNFEVICQFWTKKCCKMAFLI